MFETTPNEPPFGKIALCLSGGGYRAAAFHLGTLKTLEELNLLSEAKYFSTASGGTITAMKYVITRVENRTFKDFFNQTYKFLHQINVVAEAFKILETTPPQSGSNNLSLIRSGAEVYRRELIGLKNSGDSNAEEWTIKDLRDEIAKSGKFHDLIFNSTEFRTGNGFRFRATAGRELVFGNKHTPVKEKLYNQISLADIIASTSCFPGVFEPIRFPEDFKLADRSQAQDPFSTENDDLKTIALMDGGIFDNQGLYGMTVSYSDEPLPFKLMIVSDTTARNDELLKYDINPRETGISVKHILWLIIGFLCVLLICSMALIGKIVWALIGKIFWGQTFLSITDTFVFLIAGAFSFSFSVLILYLIRLAISKIKLLRIMEADFPIWSYLKNLNVRDLWILISGRLFSVQAMTFNVFMKRIRALQFTNTMSAIGRKTRKNLFNGKTVFVNIYDLSPQNNYEAVRELDPNLEPTPKMKQIAKDAEGIGTKLWLKKDELDILVNCGRITTCYSLLKFYWEGDYAEFTKPNNETSPFYRIYEKWLELRKEFSQ
jgi:predicted acylesterase/phospholipase RssA